MNTPASAAVVLASKVTSVSPLPTRETASRKRWSVSLEVVQIVRGSPSVEIEEIVKVQVHSVVKTFGADTSSVIGKNYRITYDNTFAKNYSDDITVDAE